MYIYTLIWIRNLKNTQSFTSIEGAPTYTYILKHIKYIGNDNNKTCYSILRGNTTMTHCTRARDES